MNTNIFENKFNRLVSCLEDSGIDPEQWISQQLKKSRARDAMETLNSEIRERGDGDVSNADKTY